MSTWISVKTLEAMKGMAAELIEAHASKLNMAFLKSEDGKLKVSLGFTIAHSEVRQNAVDVAAQISYTMEKVTDKIEKTGISEIQVELALK